MKTSSSGDFRKILEQLAHHNSLRQVFDSFICLAACALAAQTRETEYLEEAKRWNKEELELFAKALASLVFEMESHPFEDIIGGYYIDCAISSKQQQFNGEFHTPKNVCDLMARIIAGDINSLPTKGSITVCEPACGAGAMILSLAEACSPEVRRRLKVTAIDISKTACDMAFINTTLWGIPTRIIHGNALSMELWAAWSNIHYIAPWLPYAFRLETPEAQEQGQPPKPVEIESIQTVLKQQEWVF